jgi:phosphoribosylglycinamide formyltransferase-1
MSQYRIAIFASGKGTNAEAIIRHFQNHPSIEVSMVLSNNEQAFALKRAEELGVPSKSFTRAQFQSDEIIKWLKDFQVTHLVLAGFLWLIPKKFVEAFPKKIINIHPALLPKFAGKGMYGLRVHEAVKLSGDLKTGISIHEVNDQYDEGKILFQATCDITDSDSSHDIADKVHQLEYDYYPQVIEKWILGKPILK